VGGLIGLTPASIGLVDTKQPAVFFSNAPDWGLGCSK
jgi:hypothetical protein